MNKVEQVFEKLVKNITLGTETNDETEKKAGISMLLAKALTKAKPMIKNYGKRVASDYKMLGKGYKNMGMSQRKGIMTAGESASLKGLAERQLAKGIGGLGKRVALPVAGLGYLAS